VKIFKICGVTFSIHILFFPILLSLYLIGYLEEMVVLLGILFVHELSHGLAALFLGIKIQEIQILPFGGVVKLDHSLSFTHGEEIFISAAGPISNIVLSATVFFLQGYYNMKEPGFDFIIFSSLMVGFFNLIPAFPLDGGRIFRSCLSYFIAYKKATKIIVALSKMIAILLIAINIFLFAIGSYNFTLILIGIFMYYQSNRESEIATFATMRDITLKKENLNRAGSMDSQHMTVLPSTSLSDIFKQFSPKKFHIIYVLDENYALKGIITEDEILSAILQHGMNSKVKILLEKRKKY